MATGPKSFDFRESTRTPVRTEVQLQFDRDQDVVGFSANLSPGGIFVTVRDPKPIGTLLRFSISLLEGEFVRGYGEVVWIRVKYHGPDRPSGMGIRFRHLEDDGKQRVEEFILQMTGSEREQETGEDTVAAVPDSEPAVVDAAAAAGGSPQASADPAATLAVAAGEEPMAEVWLGEPGASGPQDRVLGPDTDQLMPMPVLPIADEAGRAAEVTPAPSEMLLPPTEWTEPASETQPPAADVDTAVYQELAVTQPIEFITETADSDQPSGDETRGDETLAAVFAGTEGAEGEESTGDLPVDTAVIEESELLSQDPTVETSVLEPLGRAGTRVGTDELSAAFGDLYPADQQDGSADEDGEGTQAFAASQVAAGRDADAVAGEITRGDVDAPQLEPHAEPHPEKTEIDPQREDELPRAAPWLTTPMPDEELEETLDGLLREVDYSGEAAEHDLPPVASRPPAAERMAGRGEVWAQRPSGDKSPASGLPPGSSRTAIAGAAMAEDRWKKTFLGMPSRTFLRLLAVLAVVAVIGSLFAGRIVDWIGDRRTAAKITDAGVTESADSRVRSSEPLVAARETTPPAAGDAVGDAASVPPSEPGDVDPAAAAAPDSASSSQPLSDVAGADAPATGESAGQHFRAPVLATQDGGLDLTRLQLEEGMTLRRLLNLHDRPGAPRSMGQVTDLVWRQLGDETIVSITGDGALEAGRYTQEKMPGAQPRVLIRVRGIRGEFPQPTTQVDTPQLSGIRLGYHQAEQRELHLVLDLPHEDVRVRSLNQTGAGLEVHLTAE